MLQMSNTTLRRIAIAFGIVGMVLVGCGSDQGGQDTSATTGPDAPGVVATAAMDDTGSPTERPASAQTADANLTATSETPGDGTSDQGAITTAEPTERPASAQTADANLTATAEAAP